MAQRCKNRRAVLFFRCSKVEGHAGRHKASEKEIRDKLRQLTDKIVRRK
jgi:hypothetical protein